MALMSSRGWDDWVGEYAQSHQHRVNRLCHTVGIPLIALSVPLFIAALVVPGLWPLPLALFVIGWIFQFVGHLGYEKKSPAFLKNAGHLLVGPLWVLEAAMGRRELPR